jgi:hypothetical protein
VLAFTAAADGTAADALRRRCPDGWTALELPIDTRGTTAW